MLRGGPMTPGVEFVFVGTAELGRGFVFADMTLAVSGSPSGEVEAAGVSGARASGVWAVSAAEVVEDGATVAVVTGTAALEVVDSSSSSSSSSSPSSSSPGLDTRHGVAPAIVGSLAAAGVLAGVFAAFASAAMGVPKRDRRHCELSQFEFSPWVRVMLARLWSEVSMSMVDSQQLGSSWAPPAAGAGAAFRNSESFSSGVAGPGIPKARPPTSPVPPPSAWKPFIFRSRSDAKSQRLPRLDWLPGLSRGPAVRLSERRQPPPCRPRYHKGTSRITQHHHTRYFASKQAWVGWPSWWGL